MKHPILILLTLICTAAFAQKESFDITTYTPPKGWKKEAKEDVITYTMANTKSGNWCQLNILRSTAGKGSIDLDFDNEWQTLVVKSYKPTEAPETEKVKESNGWKIKTGLAKFTYAKGIAMVILTTASRDNRCVSIIITTNSQDNMKDIDALLSSVVLKKPAAVIQQTGTPTSNAAVLGTWGVSTTTASYYNTSISEGSIVLQYTFNANGSYSFYIKTFQYSLNNLLLTRETGTYQVSGNKITVSPQKSVVESWTRKNNTDQFGKLISSQKRELEKVTYDFVAEDFGSGKVLVLKAPAETKRDGHFNNSLKDAWYYPAKASIEWIKLP